MPALAGAGHIEGAARQAGLLGASLHIAAAHTGLAIQPARLLEQRRGDVDAGDLAAAFGEQPREAARAGAEVDHAGAGAGDAQRRQPLDQLARKARPMASVIGRGATEVGWTSAHRSPA